MIPVLLRTADPFAPDLQMKSLMNIFMVDSEAGLIATLLQLDMMPEDPNEAFHNACTWKDTNCDDNGSIISMCWRNTVELPLDIAWLPPSLIHAEIHFKAVGSDPFPTRRLPQTLLTCGFPQCHMGGSLDLETLPPALAVLHLQYNKFTGTVRLTKLPRTMHRINLSGNDIRKVVVQNSLIPPLLRQVSFEGNESVKFLVLGKKAVDKRINKRRYKDPHQALMISYCSSDEDDMYPADIGDLPM